MGEVLSAVSSVRDFRDNLVGNLSQATGIPMGGGGGGGVMPIAGIIDAPMVGIAPPPDFSGMGTSQATPQMNPMEMLAAAQMPQMTMPEELPEPQEAPEPYQNPYTPELNKPIEEQLTEDDEPDAVVEGDPWKRKKAGWLGGIMDTLLMLRGRPRAFQNRKDIEKNIPSAMEGFARDPERTFRRLNQINPELSAKLREKMEAAQAADALEQQRIAARKAQGDKVMGGMARGLLNSPDPKAVYQRVRPVLQRYAQDYGADPEMFGDEYDENVIKTISDAGMSAFEQERLVDYDERLEQQGANTRSMIGTREANTASQIGYRSARLGQMERDLRSKIAAREREGKGEGGGEGGTTHVVRPGEKMQIRRKGGQIIAARVWRGGKPVMLSPEALSILKKREGQ